MTSKRHLLPQDFFFLSMTTAIRFTVYIAKYNNSCLYICSSSHAFSEAEMGRAGTEFPFVNLPRKFVGENVYACVNSI